ncbi:jg21663 [Pararge aegeria aegeria]|uniref:Jg21663 protein n=1 Tax=Pararge aegeria aegeria TaxID=348720 RepID=A0A8S4RMJ4_9NEOP|nr:jg21663 [Pararge aegeria aegeria]
MIQRLQRELLYHRKEFRRKIDSLRVNRHKFPNYGLVFDIETQKLARPSGRNQDLVICSRRCTPLDQRGSQDKSTTDASFAVNTNLDTTKRPVDTVLGRLPPAASSDSPDVVCPPCWGPTYAAFTGPDPNVHRFSELCAMPIATSASRLADLCR